MTGEEYLTTKELAGLLRIKERKVYDLAASGQVPCSRATGKLLFPRRAVEAWIASKSSGPVVETSRPDVFLGSHDPLLEWSLRESRCGLAT
jgi:excisionase family DNA binding protein